MTAAANTVWTSAQWNTYVRDNLNQTLPGLASAAGDWFVSTGANAVARRVPSAASVLTSQTTTSTSYTDLTTSGPAVTVTTGTQALVFFDCQMSNSALDNRTYMSVAVSSATTVAANDDWGVWVGGLTAANLCASGMVKLFTGLTAGSNVFTAKYRVEGGTGTFVNRHLCVIPF